MKANSRAVWISLSAFWALVLVGFSYLLFAVYPHNPDQHIGTVVACAAGMLAAAGWIVQSFIMVNISRKQHSINVIFQMRMNEVYREHLRALSAISRGDGTEFDIAAVNENKDARRALTFLLNFYENIAVAISHGDLDEKVMRDSMRRQVCSLVSRARGVISVWREEDANGEPSDDCALLYIYVLELAARWEKYLKVAVPKLRRLQQRKRYQEKVHRWYWKGEWPLPSSMLNS